MNKRNILHKITHGLLAAMTVIALGAALPTAAFATDGPVDPQPRIIVPGDDNLHVSVDKGCGSTYYEGEQIYVQIEAPESGWLTVWGETNGNQYVVQSPKWVLGGHDFNFSAQVEAPVGNEAIIAHLETEQGQAYDDSCYYYTEHAAYQGPELTCSVYLPSQVMAGEKFEIEVQVSNTGDQQANNVMVYGKANPSGYFQIEACDPNCTNTTSKLGKLHAGNTEWASYWVTAPHDQAGHFTFDFYASGHGGPSYGEIEAYCGSYNVHVQGGQFFVQP